MNSTKFRSVTALVVLAGIAALSIVSASRVTAFPSSSLAQGGDDARRITADEVRAMLKANKAVVIDVRAKDVYDAGHIRGALSIPFADIEARAKDLPRDKTIVAYCSWPSEHSSAGAVLILKKKGIDNAAAVLGGYDALVKAGFPTETSKWDIDKTADNQVTS